MWRDDLSQKEKEEILSHKERYWLFKDKLSPGHSFRLYTSQPPAEPLSFNRAQKNTSASCFCASSVQSLVLFCPPQSFPRPVDSSEAVFLPIYLILKHQMRLHTLLKSIIAPSMLPASFDVQRRFLFNLRVIKAQMTSNKIPKWRYQFMCSTRCPTAHPCSDRWLSFSRLFQKLRRKLFCLCEGILDNQWADNGCDGKNTRHMVNARARSIYSITNSSL